MAKINADQAQPPVTVEWIGGPDDGLRFQVPFGTKSCLAQQRVEPKDDDPPEVRGTDRIINYRVPITRGRRGQPTVRWADRQEIPNAPE